jgi:hypothetical protein
MAKLQALPSPHRTISAVISPAAAGFPGGRIIQFDWPVRDTTSSPTLFIIEQLLLAGVGGAQMLSLPYTLYSRMKL